MSGSEPERGSPGYPAFGHDREQVLAVALDPTRGWFIWLAASEEEASQAAHRDLNGGYARAERARVSPYFAEEEACRRALALKAREYDVDYLGGPALTNAHERHRAKRELSAVAEAEALPLLRQMRPKDLVALFAAELGRLIEEGVGYEDFEAAKAAKSQMRRARRELRGVS